MAGRKPIFGQRGERAIQAHTELRKLPALFVLRFLERERCSGAVTSQRLGACGLPAGQWPGWGTQGTPPAAMAGNNGDTSRPAAAQSRRRHMGRVITSLGLIWVFSGQDVAGDPARPADLLRQNHEETTPGKSKDTIRMGFW